MSEQRNNNGRGLGQDNIHGGQKFAQILTESTHGGKAFVKKITPPPTNNNNTSNKN